MRRVLLGMVAAALALGWFVVGTASARQDEGGGGGGGDATTEDPLDVIRDQIPEGAPGEFDLTEADERFGQLIRDFGDTTSVDAGEGSSLTGPCGGIAMSYDEDGDLLDAALDAGTDAPPVDVLDGGQAFTSDNPFEVDTKGVVAYFGFMPRRGEGPKNHSWEITTAGVSLDEGGDPNRRGNNRNAGVVDLADQLPFAFSLDAEIEGSLTSNNLDECAGSGHVRFTGGNPLVSVPGAIGTVTLLGGVFGLLFNARPAATFKV
jgi:hypothetical protein